MTDTKRVLRAPAAAKYTGLSESTLAERWLYGLPPAFLNLGGRAVGYAIEDLNSWLETAVANPPHKWRALKWLLPLSSWKYRHIRLTVGRG